MPGVSSALAAPALVGVPLTLRGVADRVVVCSGHTPGDGEASVPAWRPGTTTVFLMAVHRLDALVSGLLHAGYPADLPAMVVSHASTPDERRCVSPLVSLAATAREAGLRAPAVVLVGAVVAHASPHGGAPTMHSMTTDPLSDSLDRPL